MAPKSQVCFIEFDGIYYCFNAIKKKIFVYTVKYLDLLDVLDRVNFQIDKMIANQQTAVVGVLYGDFLNLYAPCYMEDMSLKWMKKITYRFNVKILDISFSAGGEYLLAAGDKHLALYKIRYNYTGTHTFDIDKLEEFYKIEIEETITKCTFSPDSKYFATLGDSKNMVFIWDFVSLLKTYEAESLLDGNSEDKQIVNYALVHPNDVVSFDFRENFHEKIVNRFQPNSFLTLDKDGYMRIWQENLLKEGLHFYTIASFKIDFNIENGFPYYEWVNVKKAVTPDASVIKAEDKVKSKPVFPYGVYENESLSVDWLLILKPGDSIDLCKITGLRNLSNNAVVTKENTFSKEEMRTFKNLVFAWSYNDDVLHILGQDQDNNLIKIHTRIMKEQILLFIKTQGEVNQGKYEKSTFNRDEGSLLVLTNTLSLHYFFPPNRMMPDYYHKISYNDFKTFELNKFLKKIRVSDMFSFGNYCFLFANNFEKLYIVNFNRRDVIAYYMNLYKTQENIFSPFKMTSGENCLRLLDSKHIDGEIVCHLSLLWKNSLKILEMRFSQEKLEIPEKLHNFNPDFRERVIEMPEKFLTFDIISKHSFDDEFVNYKTYQYSFDQETPNLTFLAITKKTFHKIQTIGNEKKEIFKLKCPQNRIKYFGGASSYPYYIYILDYENNITFYSPDGELISRFAAKDLLRNVDETLIDIHKLKVSITPYEQRVFLITVEKYLFVIHLEFNSVKKMFTINFLSQKNSMQIYLTLVPKPAQEGHLSHKLYIDKNKHIIIVGGRQVKRLINGCLDNFQFVAHEDPLGNAILTAENLQTKLLRSKINVPHHHPDFLNEIFILGKDNLAEYILTKLYKLIKSGEKVHTKFNVSLEKILDFAGLGGHATDEGSLTDIDYVPGRRRASRLGSLTGVEINIPSNEDFLWMAEQIKGNDFTNLKDSENYALATLIETMVSNKLNSRSLDDFASIFIFYLKNFKISQIQPGNLLRQKSLSTKEIVWALHSHQKDTLIQECIDKDSEQFLSWETVRRLGIVIWYDNLEKLKQYVEIIARTEFRKTKDPYKVTLWYILLGRKNMLATLFKQNNNTNDPKLNSTADFLLRNFNEPKNKSAASKNAYVLLGQKKYELSAAFFLLGGYIHEAVDVLATNLQDIQLAMLTCKIMETDREKPIFKTLIRERFLKAGKESNDVFLSSIGYHLLGEYVNSVNCLYDFHLSPEQEYQEEIDTTRKTCDSWPAKYEPYLSSFHPSAMVLARKLKNSINVKRELENSSQSSSKKNNDDDIFASYWSEEPKEEVVEETKPKVELKENLQLHVFKSMEYYALINIPLLGLVCYLEHQETVELDDKTKDLLNYLYEKHLDLTIDESIEQKDWIQYFERVLKRVSQLACYFPVDVEVLHKYCEQKIRSLRSLQFSSTYLAARHRYTDALEVITNGALELQNVLFNVGHKIPFIMKEKHFYQNLLFMMQEITTSLGLIEDYPKFTHSKGQMVRHMSLLPSKIKTDADLDGVEHNPILSKLGVKSRTIFFLLMSGCFMLINSLFVPSLTLKIIEINGAVLKNMMISNSLNWSLHRADIQIFLNQIFKLSQDLPIKDIHLQNPRTVEMLKQVFKIFPNEQKDNTQIGSTSRLLGECLFKYLFASSFLTQAAKSLDLDHSGPRFSSTELSIARIFESVRSYKKLHKRCFMIFLSKFRLPEQFKILQEIKFFLQGELPKADSIEESSYNLIPFEAIFPDKSLLEKLEKNHIAKTISKIQNKISSDLFLRHFNTLNPDLEKEKANILKSGFELAKFKGESIRGFCFNNYKNYKHEMIVLTNKTMKKVSLLTNILYKARYNEGLCVPEEENLNIIEKDNYIQDLTDDHLREIRQDTKDKPPAVKIAYNLLLDEKFKDHNKKKNNEISMKRYEFHAYEHLDHFIPPEATKFTGTKSVFDVHETNVLVSHPKLPFFCTGAKGTINVWSFSGLRIISTLHMHNKELINSIKFNNFGDKVGAVDNSGDMYLWKFNLKNPIKMPVYSINTQGKNHILDFCFLNESSVFAHCSLNPRAQFSIVDVLLPTRQNVIFNEHVGGSQILYSPARHVLLLANSKRGLVSCYDIRNNMVIKNLEVSREDVKCMALNNSNNVLIVGTNNSVVKYYKLDTFEEITETVMRTTEKKSSYISHIELMDDCVFASNSEGTLSFLTTMNY